jgi:cytochrome P450
LSPLQAELDLSVQLLAGIETSSYTIRGTLLYLMTAPRVYNKLKKEIAEGVQNGRISRPIKGDEAKHLPYLQVCIHLDPILAGCFRHD